MAAQRFDTSRISFGEMVAGISAAVLLISMFLPWYGVTVKGSVGAFSASRSANADAWEAYGGRDILLFLIAVAVLIYVILRAVDALPSPLPFDAAIAIIAGGAIAVLLVLIGIIHIPTGGQSDVSSSLISVDFGRKFGLFLGFLASCGIAYGGWAAYSESRRGVMPGAAGAGGTLGGPGSVPPSSGGASAPTQPLGTPSQPAGGTVPGAGAGATQVPPQQPASPASPPSTPSFSTPPASTPPAATPPASTPPAVTPPAAGTPTPPSQSQPPEPQPQPQSPPPDWYPDPHGQARLRWWDGSQRTDQTAE
ncbi:MAG: DUF2510 domain-containing protein [Gaiellaceae bacterium]